MLKILNKFATGNGDTPVIDENSSVGNLFLQMPSKSYLCNAQNEIENDENLQNFKVPQFCQSKYKGKPVFMFQGATIIGNVTISFHKINNIDKNYNFN